MKEVETMAENEILELILNKLQGLEEGQRSLEEGQRNLAEGQDKIEKRLSALENRVETIAEDTAITRSVTNTLLKWAEKTDAVVNVGLYD